MIFFNKSMVLLLIFLQILLLLLNCLLFNHNFILILRLGLLWRPLNLLFFHEIFTLLEPTLHLIGPLILLVHLNSITENSILSSLFFIQTFVGFHLTLVIFFWFLTIVQCLILIYFTLFICWVLNLFILHRFLGFIFFFYIFILLRLVFIAQLHLNSSVYLVISITTV